MTGFVDRQRAAQLMDRAGIEALVLCAPEAFHYATGASIGPAGLFRRSGAGFVVIPAGRDLPIGVVVADFNAGQLQRVLPDAVIRSHPIWIEAATLDASTSGQGLPQRIEAGLAGRAPGFSRPATFELARAVDELKQILTGFGLGRARVGVDLDFVPAADFSVMQALLPACTMVDGSAVLDRLRAIKSPREIDLLQQGIILSEAGLERLQVDAMAGMRQADLIALYRQGVATAASGLSHTVQTAEYVTLGARAKDADAKAMPGDPLKCDMVCTVGGYASDMSRNFTFGPPSAEQAELHAIAERAFDDGLASLDAGTTLAHVHRVATDSLARQGLRTYRRGHFGHGVGQSVFSEQWPFIAADSDVVIEAGMVLAFEIPLYIDGLASFNLEDQFLITPDGPKPMNRLPRRLERIG
ncbi:aminopeptidase P family protein [Mesorhizobium sp. M7A.F.Ca.US.006.04.2.1]|uniref:M24 family metallopeptidase n=1 Tax=unclassified Mesorhizobium TaxID=325217 RepID=UPI000FCB4177|nr:MULTISPECIES: Xaa-Pro peptidase family protein [unclassified Mesorhizobium]RUX73476.1 aminopeptidase P family protein [Mesorhizobium sp. M7A.F.Ca.US.005.03.1.1]RUY09691.1 aminopeptidase P family protein [Mesorhizobium sp. M7A.F.Ca.US.005.03.2.1]RUY29036.1 aminopeptidase P family protein [Mesorhizobium sp. M7A.F.Ca.US.001.04.2.1]RUY43982.1 aminopeptidase P family protein [Mesorhizobium sp. M7A.F.Ca.US.001.04.1.1]RVA06948.1 aminopeptidase P family protein [Mesorhizobium sp. M7A.F.Ca.US.001.02